MNYKALDDLKYIKKQYGEKMSSLCEELFSFVLARPGLLYHVLKSHFNPSRSLYDDLINSYKQYEFKEYIYNFIDLLIEDEKSTPLTELFHSAGYDLYECKTNSDIMKFKKYYAKNEELCTFKDSNRIDNQYVFFIVKRNVDNIKRENFSHPQREDLYSTSVLCIQFDKGSRQRVSIKSRYNHRVYNPDAVYSNDLERIAYGLTRAFEREYGFNIVNDNRINFELDNYIENNNGKFYKYNMVANRKYYCQDNIILDEGYVIEDFKDKNRFIFLDNFILDVKRKRVFSYDREIRDSFTDSISNIKDIIIMNFYEGKDILLLFNDNTKAKITINNNSQIVKYTNNGITSIDNYFLSYSNSLESISLPNLVRCGDGFLYCNNSLKELNLPKLKTCGDFFLHNNNTLEKSSLPSLIVCGNDFLTCNKSLKDIDLSSLKKCGEFFLMNNKELRNKYLPKLEQIEGYTLVYKRNLHYPFK